MHLRVLHQLLLLVFEFVESLQCNFIELSIHQKLELIKYRVCLAITGAIQGTSRQKISLELALQSLQSRQWYRKLVMFYKNYQNKSPFNQFKLIPEKASSYATRNVACIPLIAVKQNFFKNIFPICNH